MFDILTYEKGAAVVRMLEQYLGEDRFREGIRHYMSTHAYGNTDTTDLWDAVEAASGEPVRRIMDSWIFQGGHPIVSVDTAADGHVLRFGQERFRYVPDGGAGATRWAVPLQLRYGTAGGEVVETTALLDGDELEIDLPEPVRWVVANAEGRGFYRVRMAGPLRAALAEQAGTVLSKIERYGLVDDTWASVLAGTTAPDEFVALAELLAGDDRAPETDVSVWRRLLGGLTELDRATPADRRPALAERVGALVRPALERLGWEPRPGESDRDRELRAALITAAVALVGDAAATARAREVFAQVRAGAAVEANVAGAVVRAVAAVAGAADVDEIVAGFRAGGSPQEEQRFLFALADVRDPDQFARVLDVGTSTEVRTQNAPYLLGACLANRDNGGAAWAVVRDRWDELNERFPSNSIDRMLNGIRAVTDRARAEEIEAFVAAHPVEQAKQTVAQHLERMRVSVALAERVRSGQVTRG
jgi:puromycin-sensitive aminopeptidase